MAGTAVQVRGVSKDFSLPHLRQRTLKSRVIYAFRRGSVLEVQHALRDIDLDVAQGEFFGVVGRNGSGKSTLLKILAGIYPPSRGRVEIVGRLVPFIELGVGFNPELTGRQNVYLNGALLGFSKTEVNEMYEDIVDFAELDGYMDQKLKFYSSGMQVRIAFSVATRARADVLLIDEVLAVGDEAFQRKCFEHFRALKKRQTTIVFVTHNMGAVRQFCDRAILIENSRIVAQGDAEEVATEYTKLFTRSAHTAAQSAHAAGQTAADDDKNRWGEGDVRFTEVRVPELVTGPGDIVIEVEAVAHSDVEEAVYGFLISNSSGKALLGTNSNIKKQRCGGLRAGEHVAMRWRVPNVLNDGLHNVDVAVTDRSTTTMYDYWKDAACFTVVKEEKTPFMVTPDMAFDFDRSNGSASPRASLTARASSDRLR